MLRKFTKTTIASKFKISITTINWMVCLLILGFTQIGSAQICTHRFGSTVTITASGQNTGTGYVTKYVLTDTAATHTIRYVSSTPAFTGVAVGQYSAFAINYDGNQTAPTLTVGNALSAIGGACVAVSSALPIGVCSCNNGTGNLSFTITGQNTNASFTQKYILTDSIGKILQIAANNTSFIGLKNGIYNVYGVNYNTTSGITGLTVNANVSGLTGTCVNVSKPLGFIVCIVCTAGTTAPVLSATTKTNTCPATTADLTGLITSTTPTGARVQWHTVATNPTNADSVLTPTAVTGGIYYAYYIDAVNNCYSPASQAVTVTIGVCCNIASIGGTTSSTTSTVCGVTNGGTVTLSGQTGGVTKWQTSTNGGTTWTDIANTTSSLNFTNVVNGQQFRAVVKNGAACSSVNSSITTITVNASPTSPTSATVTQPTCAVNYGTISLTAAAGFSYSFDNGATYQASSTKSGLASGTYNLFIKDNITGCSSTTAYTATITAILNAPTISAVTGTNPTLAACPLLNDGTISVTSTGATVQYSRDGGLHWQSTSPITGLIAGSYVITVRDVVSGCAVAYKSNPVILVAPICAGVEICNDGIDNDGNGLIDCDDPACKPAPTSAPKLRGGN